ncbi:SA1002 family membrane protein [Fructilactobacillus cliffordii]|uniref:Uncharacterized protein n=1 Tax=Fructilactobacillus cliffordii TaxID=2940299 RepID=A0A9Q8ZTC1_9LACO|nr:hypothetical protein [Fructilactobacillus cliffordii]USS89070.1 hypothetical protein M3M40_06210 [Fructilactobacillus cliffordii]
MIVSVIILIGLLLAIGFIAGRSQDKYLFLKSGLYFFLMEITSSIALLISVSGVYFFMVKLLHYDIRILTFCLAATFIGGIINFYFIRYLNLFKDSNSMLVMQVEYYIQWTTIALTLYQFLTGSNSNLKIFAKAGISAENLDINELNLLVLPLLLISWISIAMIKIYLTDRGH